MRFSLLTAALGAALALAGCQFKGVADPSLTKRDVEWMGLMPQADIDPIFGRYEVNDPTGEKPGTIVVETKERQLYYVLPNRRAIRYGVTVATRRSAGPARPASPERPSGRPGIRRPR